MNGSAASCGLICEVTDEPKPLPTAITIADAAPRLFTECLALHSPHEAAFGPPSSFQELDMMQTDLSLPASTTVPAPLTPLKLTPSKPGLVLPPAPVGTAAPVLLFGRDERGRPHGARFEGNDPAAVERAARLMGLHYVAADTEALRDLGPKLPTGRLFPASGKAFVPFTSAALYDRLLTATDTPDVPRPARAVSKPAEAGGGAGGGQGRGAGGSGAGDPPATRVVVRAPADWFDIKVGSLVLAEDENEGGYYAATVVATKADDYVVLIWLGFDLPEFSRARRALALLHPEAAEAG